MSALVDSRLRGNDEIRLIDFFGLSQVVFISLYYNVIQTY